MRRWIVSVGTVVALGVFWTGESAMAEIRPFAVMLANSPKSFENSNGFPVGGLTPVEQIRKAYFDRLNTDIDSFVEYWEEISYDDVVITGEAHDWINLPWAFSPTPVHSGARSSPANYLQLNEGVFEYGTPELFRDGTGSNESDTEITSRSQGVLIITDTVGDAEGADPPTRGGGFNDNSVVGVSVWTPGERFLDVDGDSRWDGLDEKNDMMCWSENGCSSRMCSVTRLQCEADANCPANVCSFNRLILFQGRLVANACDPNFEANCEPGVSCVCEPYESCVPSTCTKGGGPNDANPVPGPIGCSSPGCGDLNQPCMDWDSNGECNNSNPSAANQCITPETRDAHGSTGVKTCRADTDCRAPDFWDGGPLCISGFCAPENCAVPLDGTTPTLRPCCIGEPDTWPDDCIEGDPGINCSAPGVPILVCCEYDDFNEDGSLDAVEPFEDYMIRWEPGSSAFNVWVKVTPDYVRNNYPGDVEGLISRTGNGMYDSPDVFEDRNSTKVLRVDYLPVQTPKPGARYSSGKPNFETSWFDSWWQGRYGTPPPDWPKTSPTATDRNPGFNSPLMVEFDPAQATPLQVPSAAPRRWFRPDAGGWNGQGRGSVGDVEDNTRPYDLGTDDPPFPILPEETFGYFDGWVEHDDLASSIYHTEGDKRFGEITSPFLDRQNTTSARGWFFEDLPAIAGQDRGPNTPDGIGIPDGTGVAAGPGAVNIHGDKGFDAGDLAIVELLTWRRDGNSRTATGAWEVENGPNHPYAVPSTQRTGGPIGFADYNLDGMIDQGEVRPVLSENYSTDSDVRTSNNGIFTSYPFNRTRLTEDVIEALDNGVDWDDFLGPDDFLNDDGSRLGAISGVILVPQESALGIPAIAPEFVPIKNRDNGIAAWFQNLVMELGANSEFEEGAESGTFARVSTAAHEYLHSWEGYPDLYDYDQKRPDTAPDENCPIGIFDIMAGGGLVHPIAPLKEELSGWIESVDLRTVLTPGVETRLTLPPAEFVRDDSYYYLENAENPGERYYFWAAGRGFDGPPRFPNEGLFILGTKDLGVLSNPEAAAQQQRTSPFNFRVIQADAAGDLEACMSGGNRGDDGDLWPGSSGATTFGFETDPPAIWDTQNRWTGLNINDITTDGNGSVSMNVSWTPTNIPSLRFTSPPGGETVGTIYQARFVATDVFGGTTIELYRTVDPTNLATTPANLIGSKQKVSPGTVPISMNWDISGVADGRYFLFAKLIPGRGQDGILEKSATSPQRGRNNEGDGNLTITNVDISSASNAKARSETWTASCIALDGSDWVVYSSLTQPEPDEPIPGPYAHAFTCPKGVTDCAPYHYTSLGGEVTFFIKEGSTPFTTGDTFNFTTAGITAPSAAVEIIEGEVTEAPRAVINAAPLSVRPGETVFFDASDSTDPQNLPLAFSWSFGDDSEAVGPTVTHAYTQSGTFTVTLRARNSEGMFGESKVDVIVFNNSPSARFTTSVDSGPAPLTVTLSASASSDTETPPTGLIFQWDLGDGTSSNDQGEVGTRLQTIEHTYLTRADGTLCTPSNQCVFTVQLTVTDAGGKTDTATAKILVGNTVPVASITVAPLEGPAPLATIFNAIGSSDGDDGDTLTVDWDFGDGATKDDLPLTGDAGETDGTVRHIYTAVGSYVPKAKVKDGNGGEASWEGPVIQVDAPLPPNDPPTATFTVDPAEIGLPDQVFTFDASGSTDPQPDQVLTYRWAYGDGSFGNGPIVSHAYNRVAEFQVELTVTDDRGESDSATKTITVIPPENRPPTAIIATGPRTGTAPALLTFDGRNSYDLDRDPLEYTWEFREGSVLLETMGGAVVNRLFPDPGTYSVVLTVADGRGGVDVAEPPVVITVTPSAAAPGGDGPGTDTGRDVPDSADQRPNASPFCGMGMLSGLLGSIIGLGLMAVTRGRRRP